MTATQMRTRGYKRALLEAGVKFDPELVAVGVSENDADEFEKLPAILEQMFALESPPTAVVCGNDKMAMRVYFLLRSKMNKRIPQDVSVVGYDDYRMIATNLVPALTTVALPYFQMGVEAAKMAMSSESQSKVLKISGELIRRQSTAKMVS